MPRTTTEPSEELYRVRQCIKACDCARTVAFVVKTQHAPVSLDEIRSIMECLQHYAYLLEDTE